MFSWRLVRLSFWEIMHVNGDTTCSNAGVSKAVVEALEGICKEHEGMEATIRAGTSPHQRVLCRTLIGMANIPLFAMQKQHRLLG